MRVDISEDGPYEVYGGVPLRALTMAVDEEGLSVGWIEGREFPRQETYSLCRCGKSTTKPYCDASHVWEEFNGRETASREPLLEQSELPVEGPELTLIDVKPLCASARFCDRLGGTWDATRQSDDPEKKALAIDQTFNCPAGRLVLYDRTGNLLEPELEPSIGVIEDPVAKVPGPLWVRGGIPIFAADGQQYEVRNRVTLCRCGHSRNKPFCDGVHVDEQLE